jgi:hypothetical protein
MRTQEKFEDRSCNSLKKNERHRRHGSSYKFDATLVLPHPGLYVCELILLTQNLPLSTFLGLVSVKFY